MRVRIEVLSHGRRIEDHGTHTLSPSSAWILMRRIQRLQEERNLEDDADDADVAAVEDLLQALRGSAYDAAARPDMTDAEPTDGTK